MNLCLPPDCQLSALEYLLWPKMPGTSIPGTRVEPWAQGIGFLCSRFFHIP